MILLEEICSYFILTLEWIVKMDFLPKRNEKTGIVGMPSFMVNQIDRVDT